MYIDLSSYQIIVEERILQIKTEKWRSLIINQPTIITKEVVNVCLYKSIFYYMNYLKLSNVYYINKFELEFPRS